MILKNIDDVNITAKYTTNTGPMTQIVVANSQYIESWELPSQSAIVVTAVESGTTTVSKVNGQTSYSFYPSANELADPVTINLGEKPANDSYVSINYINNAKEDVNITFAHAGQYNMSSILKDETKVVDYIIQGDVAGRPATIVANKAADQGLVLLNGKEEFDTMPQQMKNTITVTLTAEGEH